MKTSLVLLTLCSVLLLGGLGLWIASSREAPVAPAAASRSSAPDSAAAPSGTDARLGEVLARVDALSREVDGLRADLAALKAGAARQPAVETAAERPLDESAVAFAAAHREAILKVIEDDRQEQKRKQEEEQRARDLQASLSRAERTAKQFGLAADQQKQLADLYVLERQKLDDLRTQMRDPAAGAVDPQAMRQGYRNLQEWRLTQLTNRFGPDLGARIDEFDNPRFGGGPGAGGRRGNRGGGGQAGSNGSDGGNGPGGGF